MKLILNCQLLQPQKIKISRPEPVIFPEVEESFGHQLRETEISYLDPALLSCLVNSSPSVSADRHRVVQEIHDRFEIRLVAYKDGLSFRKEMSDKLESVREDLIDRVLAESVFQKRRAPPVTKVRLQVQSFQGEVSEAVLLWTLLRLEQVINYILLGLVHYLLEKTIIA